MKGTELSLSRETMLLQDLALSTIQIHRLRVQAVQMHVQFYWICKFRNLAAHICRSRRCLITCDYERWRTACTLSCFLPLILLQNFDFDTYCPHQSHVEGLFYCLRTPQPNIYDLQLGRLRQNVLTNQLREYCQCDPRLSESPALGIYFDL